jgi:uncharacterized protein YbjT (DUF2867 family)
VIIAVVGATSKTGRYVVEALGAQNHHVIAIGRDKTRLQALEGPREVRIADLGDPAALRAALAGCTRLISLAHARFTNDLLAAVPEDCERLVLTGSVRKFTALPDPAADAVREGEAVFLASNRPGVMLHPSMIYGAPDERNVGRILRLVAKWPRWLPLVLPLPDGGRHSVQPVFVDDVVGAFTAAATLPRLSKRSIIIAGPEAISYATMVKTCAHALGRRVFILPLPSWLLLAAARAANSVGIRLPVNAPEIRRAAEGKCFDISELRDELGVTPRRFAEGVRLKIERGWF